MSSSNEILRRRRTVGRSGYRQGLLQGGHLHGTHGAGSGSRVSLANSTYVPPQNPHNAQSPKDEMFADNPTHYAIQQSLLEYTGSNLPNKKNVSFRKTQTPARTSYNYNLIGTTEYAFDQTRPSVNPAEDMVENSLFSYGCMCFQCVRTTEIGIVERWGKYENLVDPGFHFLCWPISDISGRLSLRIQQMDMTCESKTLDSVFCSISVSVPFRILAEKAYDAFYTLSNPRNQMETYVFNVVRSTVPNMKLDEAFLSKSKIADEVSSRLKDVMERYGFEILPVLITDIKPTASVRQSMNEMNASKRLKLAMSELAEAERFRIIKEAEAHAETLYLHGVGIAGQRRAMVQEWKDTFKEADEEERRNVMNTLLLTQYDEVIVAISSKQNSSMILRSEPGQMENLKSQIKSFH